MSKPWKRRKDFLLLNNKTVSSLGKSFSSLFFLRDHEILEIMGWIYIYIAFIVLWLFICVPFLIQTSVLWFGLSCVTISHLYPTLYYSIYLHCKNYFFPEFPLPEDVWTFAWDIMCCPWPPYTFLFLSPISGLSFFFLGINVTVNHITQASINGSGIFCT